MARRESLRLRRIGLAAGAAVGATALFASGAQAANYEVNSLADAAPDACDPVGTGNGCTLRDAITLANGDSATDTITFQSGLTGTLTLTQGQLPINNGQITIDGPGASHLTISGDADSSGTPNSGDSQIFVVNDSSNGHLVLDGATLTRGFGNGSNGGAVYVQSGAAADLTNVVISNSSGNAGGGIASRGALTLDHSTVTGNASTAQGAGVWEGSGKYADIRVTDSTISGNTAGTDSTTGDGGGLAIGGSAKYVGSHDVISRSTISGNSANDVGGGLAVSYLGSVLSVDHTTISGNTVTASGSGGGVAIAAVTGEFHLLESTISGNAAGTGGGIVFGQSPDVGATYNGGEVSLDGTTVASNAASIAGGGLELASYQSSGTPTTMLASTVPVVSSIVADNTVAGAPDDTGRADDATTGGFDLSYSLVEAKGDAPLTQHAEAPSIVGADAKLGDLADNGGPTKTQLPEGTSPVVDQGHAPSAPGTEQRGTARTVDTSPANAAGGDGTDIGAVELPASAVPAAPAATPTTTPRRRSAPARRTSSSAPPGAT
jgi:CSLREA domain-containing protein